MNNKTQANATLQDLQGLSNSPQTVRENSSIQSGVLTNNQATSTLYNSPSANVISVPNAGNVGPSQSISVQTQVTKTSTSNQPFMTIILVCIIFSILIFIVVFDRIKSRKFI